jgi:hypothetical protein
MSSSLALMICKVPIDNYYPNGVFPYIALTSFGVFVLECILNYPFLTVRRLIAARRGGDVDGSDIYASAGCYIFVFITVCLCGYICYQLNLRFTLEHIETVKGNKELAITLISILTSPFIFFFPFRKIAKYFDEERLTEVQRKSIRVFTYISFCVVFGVIIMFSIAHVLTGLEGILYLLISFFILLVYLIVSIMFYIVVLFTWWNIPLLKSQVALIPAFLMFLIFLPAIIEHIKYEIYLQYERPKILAEQAEDKKRYQEEFDALELYADLSGLDIPYDQDKLRLYQGELLGSAGALKQLKESLQRLAAQEVTWQTAEAMSDKELAALLFPPSLTEKNRASNGYISACGEFLRYFFVGI